MSGFSLARPTILWTQVFGLALVQGAIALMWVIYNLYLPKFLNQFGFPKEFVISILICESLLAIAMEPLMGGMSDRTQRWLGTKFPLIALGVVLASALFIALPAIVIFGNPMGALRWLLPIALVAWALAMTVFRSPALSLLGQYAFASQLPQAASVLTLMGALAGALGAFANQVILNLGPAITFATGSLVLLGAAAVLRLVTQQSTSSDNRLSQSTQQLSWKKLLLIFGAGVGISLGFTIVMRSLLSPATPSDHTKLMLTTFTIVHLLSVLPAGFVAVRLGNARSMLLGLLSVVGILLLMAIAYQNPIAIGLAALFGIAWGFVANGVIPFALSLVPPNKAGLGTGMFFSGGALAASIFGAMLSRFGALAPGLGIGLAILTFIVAGLCIWMSLQLSQA